MKYYYIRSRIKTDTVVEFINFLNDNPKDKITVFLVSEGGSCEEGKMLLHLFNAHQDRITLIAGSIFSSAFYLFYHAKCERKLVSGAMGMFHYGYQKVEITDLNTPADDYGVANLENNTLHYEPEGRAVAEKIMTQAELRKFCKGREVNFTFKRMREIFKDVDII